MSNKVVQLEDKAGNNLYPLAGGMAADSINAAMLQDGIVTGAKIATGAVGTTNLADSAVTTDKVANGAITQAKTDFTSNNGALNTGPLEIYLSTTPFIDFHYQNSSSDYSARIINDTSNTLNILASGGVKANGNRVMTYVNHIGPYGGNLPTSNNQSIGSMTLAAGTYVLCVRAHLDTHTGADNQTGAWAVLRSGSASPSSGDANNLVSAHMWGNGFQSPCGMTLKTFSSQTTVYLVMHCDITGGTYAQTEVFAFKLA